MKTYLIGLGLLALVVSGKADTGFLDSLPADDYAAAELQKLTPGARARLEALVQRYKAGEAAARKEALEARQAAASQPAAAPGRKQPGWFAALLTLRRAEEKPEKEESLESKLLGDFEGWNGHTIFKLENGTQWMQQNKTEKYVFAPALHAPKVKIKPAMMNGFWLEIEGVSLNIRVIPLDLPEQK